MIYLDHAAATPVCKESFYRMCPYFTEKFFNPSAAYLPAKEVAEKYVESKDIIGHAIGAKGADIVITAGATEANNLAFTCVHGAMSRAAALRNTPSQDIAPVLYLETEHDSVRMPARRLGGKPIRVDRAGRIDFNDLRAKLTDDVELISVALANNELGTIQPMTEIAEVVRETRLDRWRRGVKTPLFLHTDASQALNLLDINVARLGVDLLTMNAAKIYGPKGVGALYVSHEVRLKPLSVGGGQEQGLRSGTENMPAIVGFAAALNHAKEHLNGNRKKYANFKKILMDKLQGCEVVNRGKTLDNFLVVCYNGIDGERLVYLLEERSVFVATGAACAASKGQKSHVLAAIGLTDSEINGSLRLTLGELNDEAQMHEAAAIINEVVAKERERISGGGFKEAGIF